VHILPVTFQAAGMAGKIERQLKITTDLGEGAVPAVTVQAIVESPDTPKQTGAEKSDAPRAAIVGQTMSR
jgi:hypothetical protein